MLYRFGDFELSEEEFALTRGGVRLPLEPRALRVLLVLAGSAGKLLDKKLLLEAVWKDTFVEESTLTRAIALIRKQLADDPREPRFIETVPTRGYRFIAAVERAPESRSVPHTVVAKEETFGNAATVSPAEVAAASAVADTSQGAHTQADAENDFRERVPPWRRGAAYLYAGAGLVVLAAVVLFVVHRRRAAPVLSTRDTIVLADFVNTTGDPAFDMALRQGLLVQLEQSPVIRLASDSQIRKTLRRMGLREDTAVTAPVGRELCQRMGGSVVLDGSVSRLGESYVIGLRARNCGSGEEMDAEQVQIQKKEDALQALSQIATQFRGRLGEAHGTLHDLDTPLAEATTPSLEALHAFSQGMRAFNAKGSSAAMPLFRYATELDPNFAWAHAWLGRMHSDLGNEALAMESTRRAYALRDRVSERERFTIDVSYDLLVTGDLEKARRECDAWVQMYPRDVFAHAFLSAGVYPAFGQFERAVEEARETIAIDPDFVVGYRNAAINLLALGKVDEAEAVLHEAAQRKVFLPSFVTDAYRIAFLKGDMPGMERALHTAPRNPWLLYYHAATMAGMGRLKQAAELQGRALLVTRDSQRPDMEAELLVTSAFTDLFYGFPEKAARSARSALALPGGRFVQASAALVLAMAATPAEVMPLVDDLRRRFPEDTVLQHNCLPTVKAAVAMRQHKPAEALALLAETNRFGVSLPLYPAFLRGEAHLALGHGTEAAAEFRSIVDHPGLVLNDPLLNVARLNLARAYASVGNATSAQAQFAEVQQRWSGAEVSFPVLQQLRLETGSR